MALDAEGAMCVRHMKDVKAQLRQLALTFILCYGLHSSHKPSDPPFRVVLKALIFSKLLVGMIWFYTVTVTGDNLVYNTNKQQQQHKSCCCKLVCVCVGLT